MSKGKNDPAAGMWGSLIFMVVYVVFVILAPEKTVYAAMIWRLAEFFVLFAIYMQLEDIYGQRQRD